MSQSIVVHGHALSGLAAVEQAIAWTTHRPVRVVVPADWSARWCEEMLPAPMSRIIPGVQLDEADLLRASQASSGGIRAGAFHEVAVESTDLVRAPSAGSARINVMAAQAF